MNWRTFLPLLLGVIVVLSYSFHRTEIKETGSFRSLMGHVESDGVDAGLEGRSTVSPWRESTPSQTRVERAKKEKEVKDLLAKLDRLFPGVPFAHFNATTSAKKSKASLVDRKDSYCVGEQLVVQLDLYDHRGKRKEYGGDFLRSRIYSPSLKAGAAGHITHYGNGTYLVNFTLFWEGNVSISLMVFHPSEGVSALWEARKAGYDKVTFTGTFLNGTAAVSTKCALNRLAGAELCEYLDERDQEAFYCVKPKKVPCEAFVRLKSYNTKVSYLTGLEQSVLKRSNIGVEIPHMLGGIRVLPCESNKTISKSTKCPFGMNFSSPSGFVWQNQWHPAFCDISSVSNLDHQINTCLKGKLIYLMGDSTARQWIEHLTAKVPTLKYLDAHGFGRQRNLIAVDAARNIQIQWKKHNHPLVTAHEYLTTDHNYVAREIDSIAGDGNTALVLALGQHFRPFPIQLFIQRMINIRRAIQRLFLRSPNTKVIIKGENVRELGVDVERFGDFHGYTQNLALRDILRGLDVGFIDAWDMTIAYASNQVHPPDYVVWNQIRMFCHYIC